MKLNIAYPAYRSQKTVEIDDEKKLRPFYDKKISEEVPGDCLGEDFKGYVFRIAGGFDKQGFAMKQGVLLNSRVRLLLDGNSGHYNPRRKGERRRKSVRGCIVGSDLSVLNLVITKRGEKEIPSLTDPDAERPNTRGPKRANNIRKMLGLDKTDDPRPFVVRREIPGKDGKKSTFKSPKIQRLITPVTLQRKRRRVALKKRRYAKAQAEAAEYAKVLAQTRKEKRQALLSKKREKLSKKL